MVVAGEGQPEALGWVLVGVAAAGFLFPWCARIHLGELWSSAITRKADHGIVDTGPYGLVRHPIDTGVLTAVVATALDTATPTAFLRSNGALGWILAEGQDGGRLSAHWARGADLRGLL
jgi:protein-S-isoprenylcysteine O-methyltransferase Ste14